MLHPYCFSSNGISVKSSMDVTCTLSLLPLFVLYFVLPSLLHPSTTLSETTCTSLPFLLFLDEICLQTKKINICIYLFFFIFYLFYVSIIFSSFFYLFYVSIIFFLFIFSFFFFFFFFSFFFLLSCKTYNRYSLVGMTKHREIKQV